MALPLVVFSGFLLALIAAVIARLARRATGWLLALLPLGIFAYLVRLIPAIADGQTVVTEIVWVPSLKVNLTFNLDGLALLMALLVSGIGALILIYTSGYMRDDPGIGRLDAYLLFFMASMLGLVLSDNLFTLFIFWELTSISSYLLIGFKYRYQTSRDAALQALLVTAGGGLAMLAGFVLLSASADSATISTIINDNLFSSSSSMYGAVLILILLGAFAKSAQFPFHFWLPNAMEAPTPVSAYLHSATMVKAGIYLLARFTPILGGTTAWTTIVVSIGGLTMLLGAYLAWQKRDLKRILAYATISVLGTIVLLLGIGTELAVEAAMVFLLAHALYKGALFMVAGSVDKAAGTRNIDGLGGLLAKMPVTFVAALVAGLSMAGLPPLLGFIAKELEYDALLHEVGAYPVLMIVALVAANALVGVAAGLVVIKPFFGRKPILKRDPHESPLSMWLGPLLLAALGLLFGLMPALVDETLIVPATVAVTGATELEHLALWHGLTVPMGLSVLTIGLAVVVYLLRNRLQVMTKRTTSGRFGPAHFYEWSLDWMLRSADKLTLFLQNGNLRVYLNVIIGTAVLLVGSVFLYYTLPDMTLNTDINDVSVIAAGLSGMIIVAAISATLFRSRLAAIAVLGVIGYSIAILFLLFGAPDLAMTQFSVETLTVVVIVLVIWKLPYFENLTKRGDRIKDVVIAVAAGMLMTLFVLVITATPLTSQITPDIVADSYLIAKGRNVVNVILVDFRGVDTFGEITVLSVAGIGVFVLSRLRSEKRRRPDDDG
ncbi:MAG: putative monovalent cation/H+ antiporter subunit A [Anaerolineae bacterium]|nr:putative monovalent cation/H+ antiporter subunit A [Anaerolineae bacterium]